MGMRRVVMAVALTSAMASSRISCTFVRTLKFRHISVNLHMHFSPLISTVSFLTFPVIYINK